MIVRASCWARRGEEGKAEMRNYKEENALGSPRLADQTGIL